MLAALVPFRPSTVVHVIETPHLARFLVGRQAFLLLDSGELVAVEETPIIIGIWRMRNARVERPEEQRATSVVQLIDE